MHQAAVTNCIDTIESKGKKRKNALGKLESIIHVNVGLSADEEYFVTMVGSEESRAVATRNRGSQVEAVITVVYS